MARERTIAADETYLTPEELSARWKNRVCPITLRNWRSQKKGPRFVKLGRGRTAPVVYPLSAVVKWEEECFVGGTA